MVDQDRTDGLGAKLPPFSGVDLAYIALAVCAYLVWGVFRVDASEATSIFWFALLAVLAVPLGLDHRKAALCMIVLMTLTYTPTVPHQVFVSGYGELLSVLAISGFLFRLCLTGNQEVKGLNLSLFLLAAFIAYGFICWVNGTGKTWANYELLMAGLIKLLFYVDAFLVIFLLRQLVSSWGDLTRVVGAVFLCIGVTTSVGLLGSLLLLSGQYDEEAFDTAWGLASRSRLMATMKDPNQAAAFYAAGLAFCFYARTEAKVQRGKLLWSFAIILVAIVLIATGSRSGKIAGAIVLLGVLLFRESRKTVGMSALIVVVLLGATWFTRTIVFDLNDGGPATGTTSFEQHYEDEIRLLLLALALDSVQNNPILGIGPGMDGYHENAPNSSHNIFLTIAIEEGLPGLGLFIAFLCAVYVKLWRAYRHGNESDQRLAIALGLALTAIVSAGQFETTDTFLFMWIVIGLCMALHDVVVRASPTKVWQDRVGAAVASH